jgi:FkbM family methyltransferase
MKTSVRAALVRGLWFAIGRRNVVRLGRLLVNEARFDTRNDLESNGEMLVQRAVLRHYPEDKQMVVFDVGANVGRWTQKVLDNWQRDGRGRRNLAVYAFEPCSASYAVLSGTVWPSGARVIPVRAAVSDRRGEATMYVVGDRAGQNSLYKNSGDNNVCEETVEVVTIDSICERYGVGEVALLKSDAEGHDMYVIEGAGEMLKRGAISLVQFEYNRRWIEARRYLRDAFSYLEPLGYQVGKITRAGVEFYRSWHPELETFCEGNYLACRAPWSELLPCIRWWNEAGV